MPRIALPFLVILAIFLPGCASQSFSRDHRLDYPDVPTTRQHDEIVVGGTFVHLGEGARSVLWFDPSGFDAYAQPETGEGRHFGVRFEKDPFLGRLTREEWTLDKLRHHVDQIVVHYDAVGNSHGCFDILQNRGLSAHFLIDTDGTIYQSMDVRERAWHATISNDRSIGIEIANIGAYDVGTSHPASRAGKSLRRAIINDRTVEMPPYTPAQDEALAALCAALCKTLPRIALNYPQDTHGHVVAHKLDDATLASFSGILGHWHIQSNKVDPGPALDWNKLIAAIQRRMMIS